MRRASAPTAALLCGVLIAASPAHATPPPIMGQTPMGPTPMGQMPMSPSVSPEADARVGQVSAAHVAGTVEVTGLSGQHEVLTPAEIAAMPHVHVVLDHEGQKIDYAGPLLSDILREVDAPMGARLHGSGVNDVVMVTAADRFRVVLSLAEVDPSFHKGAKIILADQADGRPLSGKQAPYRLVIDGDLRAARSEYAVVAIALKHLP